MTNKKLVIIYDKKVQFLFLKYVQEMINISLKETEVTEVTTEVRRARMKNK